MRAVFQVFRWSLCFLAFYAAALVREDEEGAFQNWLEEWWISIMYKRDAELSRAARFMRGVAELADRAFDSVLGQKLWSFQAVGVSLWFSLASAGIAPSIVVFVASHVPKVPPPHKIDDPLQFWLFAAMCVLFGILPSLVGRGWAFVIWVLVGLTFFVPLFGFVLFVINKYGYRPVLEVVGMVSLLVLFSYGFDVLYILITRWMLRSVSQIRRLDVIVFLVVLDVVLAIILVYGPIELMTALTKPYLLGTAGVYLLLLVMFNIGDFIACSVFFLLMVSVFAYRLVWPILERPIYALHRYGVIRRKKLLWAVVIALFVGPDTFVALIKYIVQHV